jgi:hypothetical protein
VFASGELSPIWFAAGADGSLYLAGTAHEMVELGPGGAAGERAPPGGFIARITASGTAAWVVRGDVAAATLTPDGGVFAVGPDGRGLAGLSGDDQRPVPFVWKLAADGSTAWLRTFATTSDAPGGLAPSVVAVDENGDCLAAGMFRGVVDLDPGPGTLTRDGGPADVFLVRLAPSGDLRWAATLGGEASLPGRIHPTAATLTGFAPGGVLLAGVGWGAHTSGPPFDQPGDAFALRLDGDGRRDAAGVWERAFALAQSGWRQASDGDLLVYGRWGDGGEYLTKLDAASGGNRWSASTRFDSLTTGPHVVVLGGQRAVPSELTGTPPVPLPLTVAMAPISAIDNGGDFLFALDESGYLELALDRTGALHSLVQVKGSLGGYELAPTQNGGTFLPPTPRTYTLALRYDP